MRRMQTLGLSETTPRSESRLKSLFWPSIQNATDVDYLGTQGYWICTVVALLSLVLLAMAGTRLDAVLVFLLFYLSGVGIRERSIYAAAVALLVYSVGTLTSPPNVVRILLTALLLSNLRGTWLSAKWKPESEEAQLPPRLGETWGDKFADRWPQWLWPKVRVVYYVYSGIFLVLLAASLGATAARQ